jgi:hypothetical protein
MMSAGSIPSRPEQAAMNLDQARHLRATGLSYAQIRQTLGLSASQIALIRRRLKRTKAAETRLRRKEPAMTARDLPIGQCILPPDLRKRLTAAGFRTLGDLEARLADPALPGLETLPAIGPHRVGLIRRMLEHFDLLPGCDDLKAAIEDIFPEFRDDAAISLVPAS